jgi:microcystin-dependent protein
MAVPYIGNANPPQIYADNVRDDLIPDPNTNKVRFDLSQEVPGASPENVTVIRRKFVVHDVLDSSTNISFDGPSNEIRSSNAIASALLSRIQVGQSIIISGAGVSANNGTFKVLAVVYNDPNIAIEVQFDIQTESAGATINVKHGVDGIWETLEPGVDYEIVGSDPSTYNKQIELAEVLQEEDFCYVVHRASATYNLVPSPESVGPDSLQLNLRDFLVERFVGDGTTTDFTLVRLPATPRAIIVTVNGIEKDDDENDTFPNNRDYTTDGLILKFNVAPANLAKIRVQHLGFSTVSRRASLSSGQVSNIPVNSVGSINLIDGSVIEQKLSSAPPAVSTSKVQDNAITGAKIQLDNEEALKSLKNGGGTQGLLRLNSSNESVLMALVNAAWEIAGTIKGKFTATTIEPDVTNDVSLGTTLKRFKDLFLSGAATITGNVDAGSASVTGNITVGGTVDGVDVSALQTQVNNISSLLPTGMVIQYAGASIPSGWLSCNGAVVSQTTYANLFAVVGATYNTGGEGVGNFRLPNFKRRFPLGVADAGSGLASILGGMDGNWDHTHVAPAHQHDLGSHTHSLPAHYHGMGPGSTFNIASSGGHTTTIDINHGHSGTVGSDPSAVGVSVTVNGVGDHQHTGTTNTDGAHTHDVRGTISGGSSQQVDVQSRTTSGFSTANNAALSSGSAHAHNFTTNFGGAHSHSATVSVSNGNHSHSLTINGTGTLNKSNTPSTNGVHTHASGDFAGLLGNVSFGVNGDAAQVSGAPSTNLTSSGGNSATSANNPPFLAINFIIKA